MNSCLGSSPEAETGIEKFFPCKFPGCLRPQNCSARGLFWQKVRAPPPSSQSLAPCHVLCFVLFFNQAGVHTLISLLFSPYSSLHTWSTHREADRLPRAESGRQFFFLINPYYFLQKNSQQRTQNFLKKRIK